MSKEMRQLVKKLKKQGIMVVKGKGGHLVAYRANKPKQRVIMAATPSDWRSIKNTEAQLKRDLGYRKDR